MTVPAGSWRDDCLYLDIRLQPRASRDEIVGVQADGRVKIRITAPPVDGKANAHLVRYVATVFDVPRAAVTLVSGQTGRNKRLRIENPPRLPAALKINI
jgi:uncharacterized protein (TIGR00251 family)